MGTTYEPAILVSNPRTGKCKVQPLCILPGTTVAVPLFWLFTGKLLGATVFGSQGERWVIRKLNVVGIASRQSIDAPWFDYIVLLTLGALFLCVSMRIRLDMDLISHESMDSIKSDLIDAIHANPNAYTETLPSELIRRIKRGRNVASIWDAITRD